MPGKESFIQGPFSWREKLQKLWCKEDPPPKIFYLEGCFDLDVKTRKRIEMHLVVSAASSAASGTLVHWRIWTVSILLGTTWHISHNFSLCQYSITHVAHSSGKLWRHLGVIKEREWIHYLRWARRVDRFLNIGRQSCDSICLDAIWWNRTFLKPGMMQTTTDLSLNWQSAVFVR